MSPEETNQYAELRVEDLASRNSAMQRCLFLATEAACARLPILLLGESGTGKTLLAQAIHNSSPRAEANFVSFNASAMSDTLLESQLFGHEKGAFTGAAGTMRGKFETADRGTLFFDEIADMSPLAQAKVLRAVEYGEFERLGSELTMHADVRVISATNRSLRKLIAEGTFREDLYHRLNGVTILIPPLRERVEDLPELIVSMLKQCAASYKKPISAIEPRAFDKMMDYPWPGNLRELHRVIQTMVLFADGDVIDEDDIAFYEASFDEHLERSALRYEFPRQEESPAPSPVQPRISDDLSLATATLKHVEYVFELCKRNKSETARRLGITRATLDRKLSDLEKREF